MPFRQPLFTPSSAFFSSFYPWSHIPTLYHLFIIVFIAFATRCGLQSSALATALGLSTKTGQPAVATYWILFSMNFLSAWVRALCIHMPPEPHLHVLEPQFNFSNHALVAENFAGCFGLHLPAFLSSDISSSPCIIIDYS